MIWLMRAHHISFVWMIPFILTHQFLFTTAYAKAPNFVFQWFMTAAITGLASYFLGILIFGDHVSLRNLIGIITIFAGIALLKLG